MEVVVCVGGLPTNTCDYFASFLLHMGVKDKNRSFRLFLLGELDLCCLFPNDKGAINLAQLQ